MSGDETPTSIALKVGTREKLRRMKGQAGAEGLSDDAFLSMLLDFFSPDTKLALVRGTRQGAGVLVARNGSAKKDHNGA